MRSLLPISIAGLSIAGRSIVGLCILGLCIAAVIAPACTRGGEDAYIVPELLEIEVVGEDFHWEVRYPGPDGTLGTEDDRIGRRDVHVPLDTRAKIHLRSRDYIYTIALPHLGLKEIAVPDLEYALEFDTGAAGRYEWRGDQMCGYTHPRLLGTLIVEPKEDYVRAMQKMGR